MIHSSKEHLKGKNDIAILHNKFFNFDTPNNRRQFRSQEYSQKEQSKQYYDVTINSRISSRFWSRLWPRSYIRLARELIYILRVHSECKSSTNQVQTECKETSKIYYTGISYNANQCYRVDEAFQAPSLCHMPIGVCATRGCVDIPTDDILKEWSQRFNSAKTSHWWWFIRAKSITGLEWHCHFKPDFLQFRHAKQQETVDDSRIQPKEQSQQRDDVMKSRLF